MSLQREGCHLAHHKEVPTNAYLAGRITKHQHLRTDERAIVQIHATGLVFTAELHR